MRNGLELEEIPVYEVLVDGIAPLDHHVGDAALERWTRKQAQLEVVLLLPTMRATHENELVSVELSGDAVGNGPIARRTERVLSDTRLDGAGDGHSKNRANRDAAR